MIDWNMSLRRLASASSRRLMSSEYRRALVSSDCRRSSSCDPFMPTKATAKAVSRPPIGASRIAALSQRSFSLPGSLIDVGP